MRLLPGQISTNRSQSRASSASYRPRLSTSESDLAEQPTYESAAQAIFQSLTRGLRGCPDDEHSLHLHQHLAQEGTNHHALSATYGDFHDLSSVRVGLGSKHWPKYTGMPRQMYPPAEELARVFDGVDPETQQRMNICLHTEETKPQGCIQAFDVDSFLGFPQSLAVCRRGLEYCATKSTTNLIQTDLHVTQSISWLDASGRSHTTSEKLHRIPHCYLGQVTAFPACAVYIFFPSLFDKADSFACLTDADFDRFTDRILLPSIRMQMTMDRQQHMSQSSEGARLISRAPAHEASASDTQSQWARALSYRLPGPTLDAIWKEVESRMANIDEYGLDFKGAFLFLNAKGFKLSCKETGSLRDALDGFQQLMDEALDSLFLIRSRCFVDIASEICPLGQRTFADPDSEPQVFLHRKCCLDREYAYWRETFYDGRQGTRGHYIPGFLHETGNMTLVPPKRCVLSAAGLLYSQWYQTSVETVKAFAQLPFTTDGIEELAIDPAVWQANASAAKVTHRKSQEGIRRTWCSIKGRILTTLQSSRNTSYGVRVEHRVSLRLFSSVLALATTPAGPAAPGYLDSPPPYVWPLATERFVDFMLGNYNKFVAMCEVTFATSRSTGLTLDRSRLMAALIKCLEVFTNGRVSREPSLWVGSRVAEGRRAHGLGLGPTMDECQYGWFAPLVDWDALGIAEADYDLLIGDQAATWYSASHHLIRDVSLRLDDCAALLEAAAYSPKASTAILRLMAHLCLKQYRHDMLGSVQKELRPGMAAAVDADHIQFCYEGISIAFGVGPHLAAGNRLRLKDPADVFSFVWGTGGGHKRKHFKDKPFRLMERKARQVLRLFPGLSLRWARLLEDEFWAYHWVIVYPEVTAASLLGKTTSKDLGVPSVRQWYGVDQVGRGPVRWSQRTVREGYPPKYPEEFYMSKKSLEEHILRCIQLEQSCY